MTYSLSAHLCYIIKEIFSHLNINQYGVPSYHRQVCPPEAVAAHARNSRSQWKFNFKNLNSIFNLIFLKDK